MIDSGGAEFLEKKAKTLADEKKVSDGGAVDPSLDLSPEALEAAAKLLGPDADKITEEIRNAKDGPEDKPTSIN